MNRFIIKFHRVLGTFLSILFLMWFVSGLVLVYHYFPYVHDKDLPAHAQPLDTAALLPMADIVGGARMHRDSIASAVLQRHADVYTVKLTDCNGNEELVDAQTGRSVPRFSDRQLRQVASAWHGGDITLLDSLSSIDLWLIYAYPHKEWPVLKYGFSGTDRAEIYLSSRTGDVVQYTTAESRFWAWCGAIPHWIYITWLRENGSALWRDVVAWVSGIGIFAVLSGLYVGIRATVMARRRRSSRSELTPYVKPLFRRHHVLGLLFGLFALTYVFSGFMSVRRVPQWLVPVTEQRDVQTDIKGSASIRVDDFTADYRDIIARTGAKRLTWTLVGRKPVYRIEGSADGTTLLVDAQSGAPFTIGRETCRDIVAEAFGRQTACEVSWQTEYDRYYISFREERRPPLPVWKIAVDDADRSVYYLNPADGTARYYNSNTRLRSIAYGVLHCFNSHYFTLHPTLRIAAIWVLMIGGAALSLTGIVMGIRRIRHR